MSLKIKLFFLISLFFVQTVKAQTVGNDLVRFWVENRFQGCEDIDSLIREGASENHLTLIKAANGSCKNVDLNKISEDSKKCFIALDKNFKPYVESVESSPLKKFKCKENSNYAELRGGEGAQLKNQYQLNQP